MTNFEVIVNNNPGYIKEVIANTLTLDELKRSLTGELKHDRFYNERKNKREMDFLNAEYVAPILDDIEKKYLGDVIRPFKHNVESICKSRCNSNLYFIEINMVHNHDRVCLPYFSAKSDMYKGMELNIPYTPKELGL